ncbi:hypothetical protein [Paractinoplanes rishiriensis]|uniref:hypothetical protein n=1 Tax=Paractinoplanes rishiriensis TaxID=1050105 RepID=UPI001940F475|nr:hypothetical protein [Actinoplanes rishiriensis]
MAQVAGQRQGPLVVGERGRRVAFRLRSLRTAAPVDGGLRASGDRTWGGFLCRIGA